MSRIDPPGPAPAAFTHDPAGDPTPDPLPGQTPSDPAPAASWLSQEPSNTDAGSTAIPPSSAVPKWQERDAKLKQFVKMRLTTAQLFELSKTWDCPFTHERLLRRRLQRLRLKACLPHEQLPHRRTIVEVLIKECRDAKLTGYEVVDVKIECSIAPGVRVDLALVFRGHGVERHRYFEVQLSRQPGYLYRRKMMRVKALRKTKGVTPFRFVWLVEDRDASDAYKFNEPNKVYKLACEVMADSPNMCLFLVEWLPDWRIQYDTVTEDIFMSNQQRREALI